MSKYHSGPRSTPGLIRALVLSCAVLGPTVPATAAPKTDVVVLRNGDRITGEVKGLEQGQLSFKTDATGTISIEWDEVATLQSGQYLQVELTSGLRYAGRAGRPQEAGVLLVNLGEDARGWPLPLTDVIRIAPIDQGGIFDRLDGYITAGFDYTKATDIRQFTFSGGLSTRDERRLWSVDGSTTLTSQGEEEDSNRFDLGVVNRRFLPERWFWQSFGSFDGNDELGLDLRATIGAAYGRFLVQTGRNEWVAYGGVAVTREDFEQADTNDSVEAVLGTQYWFFRYDAPEASLDATLNLFPSLTESGRLRSEGRLRARYEIVDDLFFEASLYQSYDSEPGQSADSNSDYGVTTSLGYSF